MPFRSFPNSRCSLPIQLAVALSAIAVGVKAEDLPSLVIGDAAAAEPPVGSGVVSMLVSLSAPAAAAVTATFETQPDTATAADFTPRTGIVEIPVGATRAMIRIPLLADTEPEETEQFFVKLSGVQGAVLARSQGRATLLNAGALPIVRSEPAVLYEDGPPDPKPLWIEGGGEDPITVQWRLKESTAAAALRKFPAAAGADFDPSLNSVTGRGRLSLPLIALSDVVVDGQSNPPPPAFPSSNEEASLRYQATSPVTYASFVPEFVGDLPAGTSQIPAFATTDGEWLAFGEGGDIALFHRGSGIDGTWQQAPPIALGAGVSFTQMLMRRGRLAVSTSRGMAIYEAPDATGATAWTAVNPPAATGVPIDPITGNAQVGFGFDGDTLIVYQLPPESTGSQRLQFLERVAPAGGWAIVQEDVQPAGIFILSVVVEGDTAFMATTAVDARLVEWRRTGPPERPWVRRSTLEPPPPQPGETSHGFGVLALCSGSLHARHYTTPVQESVMYRLDDLGEWCVEQRSLPPLSQYGTDRTTTFMSPGVLVSSNLIFARRGPAGDRWRVGVAPKVNAGLDATTIEDAQGKVMLQLYYPGTTQRIVASAPGAEMTLFDEDSVFWKAVDPQTTGSPYPVLNEPTSGAADASLTISGPFVPFPVSVEARITSASTATPGLDFVGPPIHIQLVRASGFASFGEFPLSIMADRVAEAQETLVFELHSPSYGRIQDPNPIVFTILDRPSILTFPSSIVTMVEPETGYLDFVIPCRISVPLMVDTAVPFGIEPRGATPGEDFTVASTVLVAAGARSCAIPVRVLADNKEEPIETFYVRLNGAAGLSLGPSRIQVRLIDRLVAGRGTATDEYTVPQNTPFSAGAAGDAMPGVGANDPGLVGTVRLTHAPSIGIFALDPSGRFVYTPPTNFLGDTTFSYEARLGDGPGTLITAAAAWKFLHPLSGVDPSVANPAFATSWTTPGFDDSAWGTGTGMFGYGGLGATNAAPDTNIGTPPSGSRYAAYFRRTFDAPGTMTADLVGEFSCDDAAIFYINGQEVARFSHRPDPVFAAAPDGYRLGASAASVDGAPETTVQTLNFRGVPLFATGNVLAVSVHNGSETSSDLGFRFVALNAVERWSEPTPVTLVVTDQLVPPVLQPDAYVCPQGGSLDTILGTAGGVFENDGLLNDVGVPFDPILEVAVSPSQAGGQLTPLTASGEFRYTPPPKYYGPDSFVYRVRDKDGWSAPAVVSITVQPSNGYDQWRLSHLGATTPTPATEPDQPTTGYGPTNLESYFFYLGTPDPRATDPSPVELLDDHLGRTGVRFTSRFDTDVITTVEATSTLETGRWDPLARWQGYYALFVGPDVSLIPTSGPDNQFFRQLEILEAAPPNGPRYYRVRLALPDPPP